MKFLPLVLALSLLTGCSYVQSYIPCAKPENSKKHVARHATQSKSHVAKSTKGKKSSKIASKKKKKSSKLASSRKNKTKKRLAH